MGGYIEESLAKSCESFTESIKESTEKMMQSLKRSCNKARIEAELDQFVHDINFPWVKRRS